MDGQKRNSVLAAGANPGGAKRGSISLTTPGGNNTTANEAQSKKSGFGSNPGVQQASDDESQNDGPMDYQPHEAFDEEEEYQGNEVSQAVENSEPTSSQQDVDNQNNFAKPYPYNQPNSQQDSSFAKGAMTHDNSMMNPSMLNNSGFYNNPYNAQMGMPPNLNNSAMDHSMATFIGNNGVQYTEGTEDLPSTATSRLPQEVRCPTCGRRGITTIQGVVGTGTVTVAVALCFCGCFVCSCVPCCMEECKDIQHTCSNCGAEVGVKEFTVSLF